MPYEFTQQYLRNQNDFYVEPAWAVQALIKAVPFQGVIHDPACGSGTIPKEFIRAGFSTTASDLRDRGYGVTEVNFLRNDVPHENIVTNPPYNLSEQFIRHGLSVTTKRLAILARIAFLSSQRRFKLFSVNQPEFVVILSRRPSMPPGGLGITASGGKTDYCWIVWNHEADGECRIRWQL